MEGRATIESIHKRIGHIVVSYKYYIIVWSGFVNEKSNRTFTSTYCPADIVWFYNCLNGMWTSKQTTGNIPQKTSGSSAAVLDDHLYIFGGMIEYGDGNMQRHRNDIYRLHLPSLTWEKLSPSGPKPPHSDKGVGWSYGGKVYFFGGYGPRPDPSTLDYNFQADIANTNGRMGWNNCFFAYDPTENKWLKPNTRGRTPDPRAAHSASTTGNLAFIFGGRFGETRTNDMYYINLDTFTWSQNINDSSKEETGPGGRSWLSFNFVSKTKAVVYGGLRQYGIPAMDYWECELANNYESLEWTKCVSPIEPRVWHQAAFCANTHELVIVGGVSKSPYDMEEEDHRYISLLLNYEPECSSSSTNAPKLESNSVFLGVSETLKSTVKPTTNSASREPSSGGSRPENGLEVRESSETQVNPDAVDLGGSGSSASSEETQQRSPQSTINNPTITHYTISNVCTYGPVCSTVANTEDPESCNSGQLPSSRDGLVATEISHIPDMKISGEGSAHEMTAPEGNPLPLNETSQLQPGDTSFRNFLSPFKSSPFKCSKRIKTPERPTFKSYITSDDTPQKNTLKNVSLEGISVIDNKQMTRNEKNSFLSTPEQQDTVIIEPFYADNPECCKTPSEIKNTPTTRGEQITQITKHASKAIKCISPYAVQTVGACLQLVNGATGGAGAAVAAAAAAITGTLQIASASIAAYQKIKPLVNSPIKPVADDQKLIDQIAIAESTVNGAADIATASLEVYDEMKPVIWPESPNSNEINP